MYQAVGHVVTGNLKIISDSRIRKIVAKGPKYRIPAYIDFNRCMEKNTSTLNHGVQLKMISLDNFFVFLRLSFLLCCCYL